MFRFIRKIGHKFAGYLGCDPKKIFIINSTGEKTQIDGLIQNFVTFDDGGFINFGLLFLIAETRFNIHNSGKSFSEKALTPPSGIILPLSIKLTDLPNKNFAVESFIVVKEQKDLNIEHGSYFFNEDNNEDNYIDLPIKITKKSFILKFDNDVDESWQEFLESSFQLMKEFLQVGLKERLNNLPTTKDNISQVGFGFRLD